MYQLWCVSWFKSLYFSCVDPTGKSDDAKKSLYDHINGCILDFAQTYRSKGFDLPDITTDRANALFSIQSLISSTKAFGIPVFLLIDEYDNFANTVMILPTPNSRNNYTALVHDEGVLRTFFKMVKSSTGGVMFDRAFITGVSPVVLSSITSGYNIAKDIFFEPEFGDLCGFREDEVTKTLNDIFPIFFTHISSDSWVFSLMGFIKSQPVCARINGKTERSESVEFF
jgi:hypothetical protein